MNTPLTRRQFLHASAVAALTLAPAWSQVPSPPPPEKNSFSFVLLGDLHYDKLEHHDMAWVQKEKPNDVSQIQNYSRITREISPLLLTTVRETIADLNRTSATRVVFVLQAGDLVEGLCGSEELSVRQNTEALAFVQDARLGAPMLFTKGNHDITGPGAVAAFGRVFHPYLSEQLQALGTANAAVKTARYTVEIGTAQFVFFDAYEPAISLEWFESIAAKRSAEHVFVVVHPPVVPYGARSTWHLFSSAKDHARREKFLALLGEQHAIVIGGHIHRFNALVRQAGGGRFNQLAVSSIISAPEQKAKEVLSGIENYTPDQIRVEPNFSPNNEAERRAVYEAERPFVRSFEYADIPGYAVITVEGPRVTAKMYGGTSKNLWRTVDLRG